MKNRKINPLFLVLAILFAVLLYFFYFKYVPTIKAFQIVLVPILFTVFILNIVNLRWGVYFFVFSFPLINNLPYFFGIAEPIPHAPTALVLFLFFFLGWLIHRSLSPAQIEYKEKIYLPLILFSLLILVSGIITFFRYTNFYPFLGDGIYEYVTNVDGVTSGGAFMSTVFFSLNYLSAFAFFFILLSTIKSKSHIKKILSLVCVSTLLALCFGLFQYLINIEIGNNPISIRQGLINATFKDALSFGTYIAIIVPLILGMIFAFKGVVRIISIVALTLSLFMIFFIGSKSGLICLFISVIIFVALYIKSMISSEKLKIISLKKAAITFGIIIILIGTTVIFFQLNKEKILPSRTIDRVSGLFKQRSVDKILRGRWGELWKVAVLMIKDYPLTGVGMGGYIIEASNYAKVYKTKVNPQSAENYFLQVGAELGLIGLVFALWVFWGIIRQIKRSYSKTPGLDKNKFILMGATAGVISYFFNILVHAYIGSYEIKYTFWLLVAFVFILGRNQKEKRENVLFGKNFKVISIILLVFFGGIHLWNSTHSLSLAGRTKKFDLKQNFGFYKIEKTQGGREFNWTKNNAGKTIYIEKPVIEIPIHASHPDIQESPVKVKIFIIKDFFKEKTLLDEIVINNEIWTNYEYSIPEEVDNEVILLIKVSRTWTPMKVIGVPDPRNLGVAVGKIKFKDKL